MPRFGYTGRASVEQLSRARRFPPTNLVAEQVFETAVHIAYDYPSSYDTIYIQIQETGGNWQSPVIDSAVALNANPAICIGLTSATTYDVRMKTIVDSHSSLWTTEIAFFTTL